MPEIGEIARIVHYLRKHVVNRTITSILSNQDDIVYGKVGCSHTQFEKSLTGKRVLDARQQGKYFWLVMDSAPHPLMHFGMTGWIKFSNDHAAPYTPGNGKEKKEDDEWPPKYMKFVLKMADEGKGKCEVAFVDPRRLARIRLVDCEGDEMRKTTPLKENGPDPVVDKDILTKGWLEKKLLSKKVPVKALLLDQANISGVGNWVADEILYQAKIHPEQYSNSFSSDQITALHDSLINVCTIACETLADSSQFPEDWLMKHRWNKGKKDANVLPNGNKIIHLKVGGRTSAVVPAVQKKTGPVAGDIDEGAVEQDEDEDEEKPKPKSKAKNAKKTRPATKNEESGDEEEKPKAKPTKKAKQTTKRESPINSPPPKEEEHPPKPKGRKRKASIKEEEEELPVSPSPSDHDHDSTAAKEPEISEEEDDQPAPKTKRAKKTATAKPAGKPDKAVKSKKAKVAERPVGGRRSCRAAAAKKSYEEVDEDSE